MVPAYLDFSEPASENTVRRRLLVKKPSPMAQRRLFMSRSACLLVTMLVLSSQPAVGAQDKVPPARKKLPDGVYAVQRASLKEKDVLPLKDGEVLVVHQHRYVKKDANEPPRFLVVRSAPEVAFDLAGAPRADKEGTEVVRILLKLKPSAATALERLTRDHLGRELTLVLGGEVVTTHKIRTVIKGGDVQITNCAPGAAAFLLEQLQAYSRNK
jgi:preprotein translocase subunit SecD